MADLDKISSKIRNMTCGVVTHTFTTGPADALADFLRSKVKTLVFIGHPFNYASERASYVDVFEHGQNTRRIYGVNFRGPEVLIYLKDLLTTVFITLRMRKRFDIYFGADPLNAFAGLILKRLGLAKTVIFYVIDYVPKRFGNPILNNAYHILDKFCVEHSDAVWNLSPRMTTMREGRGIRGNQIIVPMGAHRRTHSIPAKPHVIEKRIVFLGHLRTGQGLELIIESLPRILEKLPEARMNFIGTGPLESSLKSRVKAMGLDTKVIFHGHIRDHRVVDEFLGTCVLGLAPYEPSKESFTWFADPGKPKQYLACGLPVVTTNVPFFSYEIDKEQAGLLVRYNEIDLADAVIMILSDRKKMIAFRKNALRLGEKYLWRNIYPKALRAFFER